MTKLKLKGSMSNINHRIKANEGLRPSNIICDNFDPYEDGLSQSNIWEWNRCKRALVLRASGYAPRKSAKSANFGNIVHDVFDQVYTIGKKPTPRIINKFIDKSVESELNKPGIIISQNQMQLDGALAEAVLVPYFEYYTTDFTKYKFYDVEKTFKHRYQGFNLLGKIDGKFTHQRNKKWILDHKTKGMIIEDQIINELPLNFQAKFYIYIDWLQTGKLAKGFLMNVIRNPKSRPYKGESLHQFTERLQNEVRANPEHYFKRYEQAYSEEQIKIFGENLDMILDDIKNSINYRVYPSEHHCLNPWACDFFYACSNDSLNELESNQPFHPEVTEDTNANKTKKTNRKKSLPKRKKLPPKRK